jgi:flagellar biosynthetic protein FliQ
VNDASVTEIAIQSILLATKLAGPILIVSLLIGLGVGLVQSATQIQEQTLAFVPKLVGIALVIVLTGNWMLAQIISFTHGLFDLVPSLVK